MFDGFLKVFYFAGMIVAVLLILAAVGAANQHAKLLSMAAVGDGLTDLLTWAGSLISQAVSKI